MVRTNCQIDLEFDFFGGNLCVAHPAKVDGTVEFIRCSPDIMPCPVVALGVDVEKLRLRRLTRFHLGQGAGKTNFNPPRKVRLSRRLEA
jgi:hypothetical protein